MEDKAMRSLIIIPFLLTGCASSLDARLYRLQQDQAVKQQEIQMLEQHLERVQAICEKAQANK
jgi:uncharacterized lipoprotein YmbA